MLQFFHETGFVATTLRFLYLLGLTQRENSVVCGNICAFNFTSIKKQSQEEESTKSSLSETNTESQLQNSVKWCYRSVLLCEINKQFVLPISHDAENVCVVDKTTVCCLCHTLATQQTCHA